MKIQIIFFLFRSATGKPSAIGLWCKNIHKLNVHTQIEVGKSRKQLQFISWELFTQNSMRLWKPRQQQPKYKHFPREMARRSLHSTQFCLSFAQFSVINSLLSIVSHSSSFAAHRENCFLNDIYSPIKVLFNFLVPFKHFFFTASPFKQQFFFLHLLAVFIRRYLSRGMSLFENK